MPEQAEVRATELTTPAKNPHNIEADKYYIFNQTGNIMMSSTLEPNTPMSAEVQKIFSEVSVFYAGMSRAMANTINPVTNKPYSLYNYTALESIIKGSGLFVHVTEEDVLHKSSSFGASFSKELIESLLGLATGAGALSFATSMISSIGQEGLNISASSDKSQSKVANIVFVCEYLLGMPSISAIVVYADYSKNEKAFKAGPCIKGGSTTTELNMHKDTYMFVTPSFIREYAGDLDSINSDPQYLEMINWLTGLLHRTPAIFTLIDKGTGDSVPSDSALVKGKSYVMQGQFLPTDDKVTLKWRTADSGPAITIGEKTENQITFSIDGTLDTASAIDLLDNGKVSASSPGSYTVSDS